MDEMLTHWDELEKSELPPGKTGENLRVVLVSAINGVVQMNASTPMSLDYMAFLAIQTAVTWAGEFSDYTLST
jgi:hypothetical protein